MVNLDDESEFELVERPDVTSNQFVADVGGAAGFMLGISVGKHLIHTTNPTKLLLSNNSRCN